MLCFCTFIVSVVGINNDVVENSDVSLLFKNKVCFWHLVSAVVILNLHWTFKYDILDVIGGVILA